MPLAFYMRFVKGHHGAFDRIGGVPSHLPPSFPHSDVTGRPMAFLAQFLADEQRLPLTNALGIHVYQAMDLEAGDDPLPVVIQLPIGSPENHKGEGRRNDLLDEHDIEWDEPIDEPERIVSPASPVSEDFAIYRRMIRSKLGGSRDDDYPYRFLGRLREAPAGLNFSSWSLGIFQKDGGELLGRFI